jgi:hypothetical protein
LPHALALALACAVAASACDTGALEWDAGPADVGEADGGNEDAGEAAAVEATDRRDRGPVQQASSDAFRSADGVALVGFYSQHRETKNLDLLTRDVDWFRATLASLPAWAACPAYSAARRPGSTTARIATR